MRKQHPQHRRVVDLIRAGKSDRGIYDLLHVNRKYIAAVRAAEGVAPFRRTKTVDEQLDRFCSIPDPDGHVHWSGSVATNGTPRIRMDGNDFPAAHQVFERRAGRPAEGQVRADCGMKHCLAPGHVMDDIERRKVRLQTRALLGYKPHWDTCSTCGADWETEGRVEERLAMYCRRCTYNRKVRNRKDKAA